MQAVLMERGRLWVESVPVPKPGPGEVLVKTLACGICGSDLHAAKHTEAFVQTSREAGGAFQLTTFNPVVMGHEFCAEVVEYGAQTERTINSGAQVCSVPMLTRQPPVAVGYSDETPGGFAEYMVLSESLLEAVPDGLPAHVAALTEPMAVGLHAVNKANIQPGEAALVIGCGPVGLATITALKAAGVGPIVASDYSEGRRSYAVQQGADVVFNPELEDPFVHPDLRRAKGVVIFECVGVPGMLDRIFVGAQRDARVVVVGVCLQTDELRPLIAINKELQLQFVLGYTRDEFRTSLQRIADGSFDVVELVTARVGLDQVAASFKDLADPELHAKVVVEPWR